MHQSFLPGRKKKKGQGNLHPLSFFCFVCTRQRPPKLCQKTFALWRQVISPIFFMKNLWLYSAARKWQFTPRNTHTHTQKYLSCPAWLPCCNQRSPPPPRPQIAHIFWSEALLLPTHFSHIFSVITQPTRVQCTIGISRDVHGAYGFCSFGTKLYAQWALISNCY